MKDRLVISVAAMSFAVLTAMPIDCIAAEEAKADSPEAAKFYREQVAPILAKSCFSCHGPESKVRGGLFLGSRKAILKGGDSGPAVDLDDPKASIFLEAINFETYEMPPKGKLPEDQLSILTKWVLMGAPIPAELETERPESHSEAAEPEVNEETKSFWSFQPIDNPSIPAVESVDWVSNPIDRFILAKLEAAGLSPVAPVERAKLIRRAYYDLTGLPPSIEEVESFARDNSDRAFEKVVDRLLESPQYGERWGRHWLDLVRYAETNSYERDGPKPHIWRYRDYVIRSFNEDKPYSQFIKEQLAGDEFEPKTRDSIVATGFYRLGIWDDEPVDPKQALYDDLDDVITTTSQVFLGLTMNCCRCHNHKIDPLPQKDYYRFLAFFSGYKRFGVRGGQSVTDNSIGPIAVSPEEEARWESNLNFDRELVDVNRVIGRVERKLQPLLSPPEKEDFRAESVRVDLAKKYERNGLTKKDVADYEVAMKRRHEIRDSRPGVVQAALIIKEVGATPRDTFVLARGNSSAPGEKVEPGFPSVLSPPEPVITPPANGRSCGRRTALANWIASEDNPLTARVMVNRIWQHHFGRGIVRSANNFGNGGDRPTHPELLDWLATEFMNDGWMLKSLHRKIMLSSTYQMSSESSEEGLAKDPANNLFWRFNMRRLSAEEMRDSILAANGSLNLKMGGPSIYSIIPQEVLAGQSRPGSGWGTSSPEERARRACYIYVKRSLIDPMMANFDFADADSSCPVRFVTTQPTQALGLMNSEFVNRQARVFADYLKNNSSDDPSKLVETCLLRITQRRPSQADIDRGVELIESLQKDGLSRDDAIRYFCLISYNFNEFLYLD